MSVSLENMVRKNMTPWLEESLKEQVSYLTDKGYALMLDSSFLKVEGNTGMWFKAMPGSVMFFSKAEATRLQSKLNSGVLVHRKDLTAYMLKQYQELLDLLAGVEKPIESTKDFTMCQ